MSFFRSKRKESQLHLFTVVQCTKLKLVGMRTKYSLCFYKLYCILIDQDPYKKDTSLTNNYLCILCFLPYQCISI